MHEPLAAASPLPGERAYAALSRLAFGAVWLGSRLSGAPSDDLRARRGLLPAAGPPLFWFHGASAGELAAAEKLVLLLRRAGYEFTAGYTAANRAGVARARRAAGDGVASLAPWDSPSWVARAFDRWRPSALFLVETELWPSLILTAARRGVPVLCVSARIYPRDARRYALVRRFVGPLLRRVTAIAAQSEVERDRFVQLGAVPDRCRVAGNLKYLGAADAALDREACARDLGCATRDRVVVVGSIHYDEVRSVLAALEPVVRDGVRLIVAPRRPDACRAIAKECRRLGWSVSLRSAGVRNDPWRVLVLDTMGELERAYAIAALAVVGGGFGKHGGHNPYEPILAGIPTLIGPHFEHFDSEASSLSAAAGETRVRDAHDLAARVSELFADEARRLHLLERQRAALPDAERIGRAYLDTVAPPLRDAGIEAPAPAALCRLRGR